MMAAYFVCRSAYRMFTLCVSMRVCPSVRVRVCRLYVCLHVYVLCVCITCESSPSVGMSQITSRGSTVVISRAVLFFM